MSGRSVNQGVKLMIIRDYLYSHTNKNHYVTVNDIIEHLDKEYGISADRKAIYHDLERLEDFYNMKLDRKTRIGVRVTDSQFEPYELRLMIDSVQSANFITEKEAANITNKIKNLADIYTKATLDRKSYVHERIDNMKESIVSRTDSIHEAISLDARITFKYVHHKPNFTIDEEKKKSYSKNGEPYVVSPFALYWNNGNYYLYAYDSDKKNFRYFRIDRMESIKIDSEKREGHDEFNAKTFSNTRKAKVFGMYSTGNAKKVKLRGINQIADQVVDAFGARNVMLIPEKDGKHFTADVDVEVSPTFFAWVFTFGKKMKIINPPEVVEEMKAFIGKVNEMYE